MCALSNMKALLLGVTLLASPVAVGSASAEKIQITVPAGISVQCLQMDMLRHEAFPEIRKKYNLEFEVVNIQGAAPVALSSGYVNIFSCAGISEILNAYKKGAKNMVVFGAGSIAPIYQLISKGGLDTLNDLRGKKIGIPSAFAAATEMTELIMDRGTDLKPGRDYDFVSAGSAGARVAAFLAGEIDALPTYPPFSYELADQGNKILADAATNVPKYITGIYVFNREWAEQNKELAVRLLKALAETGQWLENPANKEAVIDWLSTNYVGSGNKPIKRDHAIQLYNFMIEQNRLAFNLYADSETINVNLNVLKEKNYLAEADIPPLGQLFDYSYLNAALRELGLPQVAELPN